MSFENGLSEKEAKAQLEKFGLNEIKENKTGWMKILVRQFKSPFFYLIFGAVIVSFIIGEKVDSLALLAFIAVNVIVGFFQEFKAERAVALLKKIIQENAKVRRNGKEKIIERKFIVPGDIVLLEAGDIIPADLKIIACSNFLVDESVLSGESFPVASKQGDAVFAGTTITSGKAEGVVTVTGNDTSLGGIAKSISSEDKNSAYEKNMLYFSRLVLKIVSTTIVLVFVANIFLKGLSGFAEFLLFSVALIVSILPEALPAVVTFALSKGSLKMAKEHVVVKRLSAIEDLGNIDILCTDKTGTLTQNKLSLEKIVTSDRAKCLLYGALGSASQSPFDKAILARISREISASVNKYSIISELPFDSFRMLSSVMAEKNKEKILIVKGSPESVLKHCAKFSGRFTKQEIKEDIEREGRTGKRVLALAYKIIKFEKQEIKEADERGLTFLGYFVFEDPLKPTAEEAIKLSRRLGVEIKIITGDSKEVAECVAMKTGLLQPGQNAILAETLEKMQAEEFEDACEKEAVFARISPSLKHKIIRTLERRHEVGFMGEGVNDAPALKSANVGIAVLEATDIAREASDVVLLRKDLRVVINGIKDGRTIFSNINKYIKCALASNFGNFYSIAVISLFVNFLPMLPVQILLGNLLSDFPLISIATDSVDIDELKKPKAYQLHTVLPLIISLALVSTVFDFIFFSIFKSQQPSVIQTLWFIESILTEILLIFIIRTRGKFWKARRPSIWLMLFTAIDAVFIVALPFLPVGQEWFHFITPPILPLFILAFLIIAYFIISELVKLAYFNYFKPLTTTK